MFLYGIFQIQEERIMSRIQELSNKILQARSDYYNNQPTVSDDVFDAWVSR